MKKLLSIVAIGALMTTVNAGNLVMKANVIESSQVTIGAAADNLVTGTEVVKDYAMADYTQVIDLGATTTTLIDEDVHLKTNNKNTKIQMTLTYTNMTNETGTGSETIALKCEYDQGSAGSYSEKATTTPFDLSTTAYAGVSGTDHVTGKLKITAIAADANQVHGNYSGTVVATIATI
jgi:hypothetical protein